MSDIVEDFGVKIKGWFGDGAYEAFLFRSVYKKFILYLIMRRMKKYKGDYYMVHLYKDKNLHLFIK